MKTASQSGQKFVERAGAATADYVEGALRTNKDQAANAIAATPNYVSGVQAAIARGAYAKGLTKSGKAGWAKGIQDKGQARFAEGVASGMSKYVTNSGAYDSARSAAESLPRGAKGSEANYARAKAVGVALRKQKVGA